MKTNFQDQLMGVVQLKINGLSDASKEDLMQTVWKDRVVSTKNVIPLIYRDIQKSIESGCLSDVQLLNRICSLFSVKKNVLVKLLSTYHSSESNCLQQATEIMSKPKVSVPFIFSESIKDPTLSKDDADFYEELDLWVKQASEGEDRVKAQKIIQNAYEINDSNLSLAGLGLTQLPSVITRLTDLSSIDLINNQLTKLPEGLNKYANLENIDLQNNPISTFPEFFYLIKHPISLSLMGTNIETLTPGMLMLINKFDWNIHVNYNNSDQLAKEFSYHKDLNHFTSNSNKGVMGEELFSAGDNVSVINKSPLDPEVDKILMKAHDKKEQPKSQENFIKSIESLDGKNKRIVITDDGNVNVFGCASSIYQDENSLGFIYENIGSIIFLNERTDDDKVKFMINCSGSQTYRPTQVKSSPILDFQIPRLEHYDIALEELKKIRSSSSNKPKAMMICCGEGEGRTGSFLAMIKIVDLFKKSDQEESVSLNRDCALNAYEGKFSKLDSKFKTTAVVASVVNQIRKKEKDILTKAVSIETEEQVRTLELMCLMLIINKKTQVDASITDEQILKLIYDNGFTKHFIANFGSVNFTAPDDNELSENDMHKGAEKRILQRIRNIHTFI